MAENMERARQLERELKTLLKGEATPGSGNKRQKGDVKSGLFLAEAKYRTTPDLAQGLAASGFATEHLTRLTSPFPFDVGWLETITTQAIGVGKIPVLAIEWTHGMRLVFIASLDAEALGLEEGALPVQMAPEGRCPALTYPSEPVRVYAFPAMTREPRQWIGYQWETFARVRRELDRAPKEPRFWGRQRSLKGR